MNLHTMALYHLAGCCAKASGPDEALAHLRAVNEARPDLKDMARNDTLPDSLRSRPEFEKLVGS